MLWSRLNRTKTLKIPFGKVVFERQVWLMGNMTDKQKLLYKPIESLSLDKNKLTAARVIAIQDNQKAVAFIKSMMDKK